MRSDRPFSWIIPKRHRRRGLAELATAIRAGWLDTATPEHRAEMIGVLMRIYHSPDVSAREMTRLRRVLDALRSR